jgi:uncharacterized protein (TIRG00374 family)
MPSSIGGDAFKAYLLTKDKGEHGVVISSVIVDRLLGVTSLFLVAFVFLMLNLKALKANHIYITVAAVYMLFISTLLIIFYFPKIKRIKPIRFIIQKMKISTKIENIYSSFYTFLDCKRPLLKSAFYSISFQLVNVIIVYLATLALEINTPLKNFFVFVPLVTLSSFIPISINGIGVRESAYVFFSQIIEVTSSEATAISLLCYFLVLAVGILGGIIYLIENRSFVGRRN